MPAGGNGRCGPVRLLGFVLTGAIACWAGQAAAQSPAPEQLEALVAQCAPCHGVDGHARDVEVPHLAGQHDRYLWNQMIAFRRGTRRHEDMRYMSRSLSEAEIAAIVAYYAALPR